MTAIPDLPPPGRKARFASGFGCRFIITVDTEEEFDWSQPLSMKLAASFAVWSGLTVLTSRVITSLTFIIPLLAGNSEG